MSNSFNISVKPEIAAVSAKVDANKTEIDAIRATDIPGTNTKVDANKTVIDDLHDSDIPALLTALGIIDGKIDTIDGIADSIKLKTDAMPQKVRGESSHASLSTSNAAFQEVLNITGTGKIQCITIRCVDAADTLEMRVTIDGRVFAVFSKTGSASFHPLSIGAYTERFLTAPADDYPNLIIDFGISLLIELRRSAGSADNVECYVIYSLDNF